MSESNVRCAFVGLSGAPCGSVPRFHIGFNHPFTRPDEVGRLAAFIGVNDMTDDMPEVARIAAFEIHHDRLMREIEQLKKDRDFWSSEAKGMRDAMLAYGIQPIPMVLHCPKCRGQHIDREEWATHQHRTHRCEHCGELFRVAKVPTVGVEALP